MSDTLFCEGTTNLAANLAGIRQVFISFYHNEFA